MTKEIIYVSMELWGGIFCLVTAFCTAVLWRRQERPQVAMALCAACMLFADSVAWYYRGKAGAIGILKASNFLSFLFSQLTIIPFTFCLYRAAQLKARTAFWLVIACNSAALALTIATLFTPFLYYFDEENFYHRTNGYILLSALTLIQMGTVAVVLVKNRRRMNREDFICLLLILVLPIAAVAVQSFIYGWSLSNIAITVGIIIIFLNSLHAHSRLMDRQRSTIQEQKDKLRDQQTKIALSQIKPHFLYNALNSVYALCGIDVAKGRKALSDLSDYLSGNIESIESTLPIPFSRELSHIRAYLSIEALRFPQKLHVEYDIQTELFTVPALTVQPLVENAIKHGICKKVEGGTVWISTHETKDAFVIVVKDDGAGFDTDSFFAAEESGAHIGIRNVRERLKVLSGGTLRISSAVGMGTEAVIELPKLHPIPSPL